MTRRILPSRPGRTVLTDGAMLESLRLSDGAAARIEQLERSTSRPLSSLLLD